MKLVSKIINGEECKVCLIGNQYLRCSLEASYCKSPVFEETKGETHRLFLKGKKNIESEKIGEKMYCFSEREEEGQTLVCLCKDESCTIQREILVPFDTTEDKLEEMLESMMNEVESLIPELADEVSSSSWWLGKNAVDSKDFLLSKKDAEIISSFGDGLKEAVFHPKCSDEKLLRHDGETVYIVRRFSPDEADMIDVGPMYHIMFRDGKDADAFADELQLLIPPVFQFVNTSGMFELLSILLNNPESLTEEGEKALEALEGIYLSSENQRGMAISNLFNCEDYILWTKQDIESELDSGLYDEELAQYGLVNADGSYKKEFIKKVSDEIDWNEVASECVEAGTKVIRKAIREIILCIANKG